MIETVALTLVLAAGLRFYRFVLPKIATAWRWATPLERIALCLMLCPIPGPVDELIGAAVLIRIARRKARTNY